MAQNIGLEDAADPVEYVRLPRQHGDWFLAAIGNATLNLVAGHPAGQRPVPVVLPSLGDGQAAVVRRTSWPSTPDDNRQVPTIPQAHGQVPVLVAIAWQRILGDNHVVEECGVSHG